MARSYFGNPRVRASEWEPKTLREAIEALEDPEHAWKTVSMIQDAIFDAQFASHDSFPDDPVCLGAAWHWLHTFRDAGKKSAYGPLQEQLNADANSHGFTGFLVGWAAAKAYYTRTDVAAEWRGKSRRSA